MWVVILSFYDITNSLLPYIIPSSLKVVSIDIPESELLLHADCNEQEVTCEISPYFPQGTEEDSYQAYFIGSVQLEGGGISLTLVLQTLSLGHEGHESVTSPLMHKKLGLPLSQSGTLLTEGEIGALIIFVINYISICDDSMQYFSVGLVAVHVIQSCKPSAMLFNDHFLFFQSHSWCSLARCLSWLLLGVRHF